MRTPVVVALVAALTGVVACDAGSLGSRNGAGDDVTTREPGALHPLPTTGWDPNDPTSFAHFAAVHGVLAGDDSVDGGCVWLQGSQGQRTPIVWPKGYQARFEPRIEVVAPDGTIVARGGDRIGFGGQGASPVPKDARCMLGASQAAYVESDVDVAAPAVEASS